MNLIVKLIMKMNDSLVNFSYNYTNIRSKVWFLIKMKKYVNNKLKLDSNYKKEIKNYYKPYTRVNTRTHKMYLNATGEKNVKFIPDYIFFSTINPYLNNVRLRKAYEDKSYYDIIFKELKRPETIVRNVNGV